MTKTTSDIFQNGRWLQRRHIDGKYTWTVSGVLWNNLKDRCNPNGSFHKKEPTYIGSRNEFSSFQEFVEWNQSQIGYGCGYEVDSDILKQGSKVYSKDTCLLVPPALNRFIQSRKKERTQDLPRGTVQEGNKLLVRLTFKNDLTNKDDDILFKYLELHEVDLAIQLYKNAFKTTANIWYDRLVNSGRYQVDPRVIDYIKNYEYKCDWRSNV